MVGVAKESVSRSHIIEVNYKAGLLAVGVVEGKPHTLKQKVKRMPVQLDCDEGLLNLLQPV